MANHPQILIIGGGVIGLTTAYFLAREGARVQVIDKGEFGQESSWAGAGIITPSSPIAVRHPLEQIHVLSTGQFPSLSAELREATGIDNGFLQCGGLEIAEQANEKSVSEWRAEGLKVEALQGSAIHQLEPALAPRVPSAYHLPEMSQVRNPRHLRALLAACAARGVELRPGCPIHGFLTGRERVTAAKCSDGLIHADRFLITAGAWTDPLLEQFGLKPDIHPVRGQIALLNTRTPLLRRIILEGSRYLVPRADGRVLVGSTEEHVGYDKRTTASAIAELIALACSLVPALAHAQLERSWAGLRPGTRDGMPFLGPVPGCHNLFVAAGHFRSGIQHSPGTALVMKSLLLGQRSPVALEPFRLDRSS